MTKEDFFNQLQLTNTDVLAIDGPCGSGKSTLAEEISARIDVDVIHLDDFFLPLELRIPDRLLECGGNVHYERFIDEVIMGILSKKPFFYSRFSCQTMTIVDTILVQNNKPIVIEGAYSLRPDFRSIYTQSIYLEIDASLQKQRLINRVGTVRFHDFETLWIPKEIAYFERFQIKDIANIVIHARL